MAGDEVRVDPDDLNRKAGQIEAISWGDNPVEMPTVPADGLGTARTAVENLNQNAKTLTDFQEYGKKQGQRLAETLRSVAAAYRTVDQNAMDNINKTIPGETPAPPAPVIPAANAIPAPTPPQPLPTQRGMTDEYMDVKQAQGSLLGGDQAASLQAAAAKWAQNGATLAAAAANFETSDVNWEGEAADAAYRQFADYRGFLVELSGAWTRLAAEAEKVAMAHATTLGNHTPIAEEYAQLEAQLPAAIANGGSAARVIQLKMEKLQQESEEIRHQYALDAQPDDVNPPEPPRNTGAPPTPVRSNGDPRRPAGKPPQEPRGGGSGQSAGGGGQPDGGAPAQQTPQEAQMSPMSAADQAAQAAQQGGSPGGGSPGGGSPSGGSPGGGQGGGAPGGAPGAGMPGLGKGEPKVPTGPLLKPAAAAGGGAGSGGGGGGAGMPAAPLQPAVSAETVAPTPVAAASAHGAAPGGAAGAAGAPGGGGGMGGMAPMHGAQSGGSGEKKRNPQLSQDEDLYTEERPWTEAVIGNRVRRRGAPDDMKKES
ncbi:PPE family protein [Mycolicibacterium chubuense NBB4]|uniref:PPE family protein n=1 Tax=Mycolicibacterium chubuense (strain NBB4) TaxID=710421 RepID=I4BCA0_MYCCN|nr:PPE domain-containing protein [Mycolicibacterium chubuense]AFM14907.1 PPE family protein [Mycolicibacterium chubuense NBB4]